MEWSRRRERELERLGDEAQALWTRQREVLGRASDLVRDVGRTAGYIGREDLYPRARAGAEQLLAPTLRRLTKPAPRATSGLGAGSYVLMGIGAIALAVIGYAVWNTLRPDEDLWIDADEDI